METKIFEQIKEKCQKKKAVSLCNKLLKKCSFKSGADCENLCHLAYWLYIYGEKELAMGCVALTHNAPFEANYNVWDFIHFMWGLQMRLLREQGKEGEAQRIADAINAHLLTPSKIMTPDQMPAREEKRRSRFTYEDIIVKEKVERALRENDLTGANEWRFIALLGMIGNTETGFYPKLNEHKRQIEEKIIEYISELSKS
ncbi:MAG: hypothetical protein LBU73_02685 [Helicobacteraceae bacterium]|nr:hypothetical protein [Helicobacteraceae bacterium]